MLSGFEPYPRWVPLLGVRGFSCTVSGFGQVFAARVFGLRPNICRPATDETKLPVAHATNLWYPGYKYITTVYKHLLVGPSFHTSLDFRIEKAQLRCQNPYLELDIEQRM